MKIITQLHTINLYMLFAVVCALPGCVISSGKNAAAQAKNSSIIKKQSKLPQDLLFKGKPVSNEHMKALVPILCDATESKAIDLDTFVEPEPFFDSDYADRYEWSYIGTLPNGDHLIHGYLWPAGAVGQFTQIASIQREGDKLTAIPLITGGNRHATSINAQSCMLKGNLLTYRQGMTNGLLYETITIQHPELSEYTKNKNKEKLYWGEADYIGEVTFEVTITPENKSKGHCLKYFTLAEGVNFSLNEDVKQYYKEYYDDWLRNTKKNSLAMGDAVIQLLQLHGYKDQKEIISANSLKEIMLEVYTYAKNV